VIRRSTARLGKLGHAIAGASSIAWSPSHAELGQLLVQALARDAERLRGAGLVVVVLAQGLGQGQRSTCSIISLSVPFLGAMRASVLSTLRSRGDRSETSIEAPGSVWITRRWISFSSSRMLPGHGYAHRASSASLAKPWTS